MISIVFGQLISSLMNVLRWFSFSGMVQPFAFVFQFLQKPSKPIEWDVTSVIPPFTTPKMIADSSDGILCFPEYSQSQVKGFLWKAFCISVVMIMWICVYVVVLPGGGSLPSSPPCWCMAGRGDHLFISSISGNAPSLIPLAPVWPPRVSITIPVQEVRIERTTPGGPYQRPGGWRVRRRHGMLPQDV